ncbi:MAG: acyl carrier protein [Propionibacterium sp.]
MAHDTRTTIRDFIVTNYLFGDDSRAPEDDQDLLLTGIVDSTGILELIEFLESSFGFQVLDTETIPDNLGSITNLTRYVGEKTSG